MDPGFTPLRSTEPESEPEPEPENTMGRTQTQERHKILVAAFALYSIVIGYIIAVQPSGAGWRFFSWHPFLMNLSFVGLMGTAAVTKKLGGYMNTKLHGIMASAGVFLALGGLYIIYKNKEMMGKQHLTSSHSIAGICTVAACIMVMLVGGIFLHPDFGVDKTNQNIRFLHKWFSRFVLLGAWVTCVVGLYQLTTDTLTLVIYAGPMVLLAPFTLV